MTVMDVVVVLRQCRRCEQYWPIARFTGPRAHVCQRCRGQYGLLKPQPHHALARAIVLTDRGRALLRTV